MKNPFPIPNEANAREYLSDFDDDIRELGVKLWQGRAVIEIVKQPYHEIEITYLATVQDTRRYRVEMLYDDDAGWEAYCNCDAGIYCEHVFAAFCALLNGVTDSGAVTPQPARAAPVPLRTAVARLLGRELKRPEMDILRRVELQLHTVRFTGRLSAWDLETMGFGKKLPRSFIELPWIPHDPLEFLQLAIHLVQEQGFALPPFLDALSRDPGFKERIAQAQRLEQIEKWKNIWRNLTHQHIAPAAPIPTAHQTAQFRLRLTAQGAITEWQPSAEAGFRALKKGDLQLLQQSMDRGQLPLDPGNALLWSVLEPRQAYGIPLTLKYDESADVARLRMLLSQPAAAAQLVNASGGSLLRPTEPLRWQLTSPDSDPNASYRLQLVRHDGRPLTGLYGVLRGAPSYYLVAEAVYQGPALPHNSDALEWLKEQEIPSAAVEAPEGILGLRKLGVALPEKLESQIRTIPVKVKISCQLTRPRRGLDEEICLFDVTARSSDKLIEERWIPGSSWINSRPHFFSAPRAEGSQPVVYDRTLQERAEALLAQLPLRPQPGGRPGLKVTKTFAQTFLDWLRSVPPEIPVKLHGELASLVQDPLAGRIQLQAEEVSVDWFDLKVVVDVAQTELTAEELKLLLAHPGKPVRLPSKGWRRLNFDLSEQEDQQLARLGLSPQQFTDEPQRLHALQLADDAARSLLPEGQSECIQRRASEIRARVTPLLPDNVQATLRPYQTEGFHFLAYLATNHFGGILADDMGLGKTLQTLVWVSWLHEPRAADEGATSSSAGRLPTLVICPKSVMDNWRAEAEQFTPGLKVKVWSGLALANLAEHLDEAHIHVVNYAQLRLAENQLVSVRWLAVILDEGQFIKNPNSQTAQAARRLQGQHRLILSGTPIENRLLDLWSLLSFAMPGILGNRATFQRIYDAAQDPLARQRLAARVRPFLLRRTKAQVAKDLPDRIEEDLYCEMEGLQLALYQAELKHARQMLLKVRTSSDLAAQQFNFLTSLLRLRQICCHPALISAEQRGESAKFNTLLEQLELLMAEGHKVLVFSQFVGLLELLEPELKTRDWPFFILTGATENRAERVKAFQSTEGGAIFLLSLKAGGFGLNLTAASYVMLFDPWWNPAVENQAIDRTHRIGQNRTVMAYRLLVKNSIEEKVRQLQKQKKSLADDILGEERFAQALTLDDFQFLFSD